MKKLLSALGAFIILGIAWYIITDGTLSLRAAKRKLLRTTQEAVVNAADPDDVAALAMKVITMTQGEKGAELWRLKADWGNLRRRDNIMELEKPRFTYYMGPGEGEVTIVSERGEIEQGEQHIRFIDSVVATHQGRVLHAPLMEYFGKDGRKILCPKGGELDGPGYEGSADLITWFLNNKTIESVGNVDITFESDKDIFSPKRNPEGAQTPETESSAPAQS